MAATTAGRAQAGGSGGAIVIFLLLAALALGGGHTAARTRAGSSAGLSTPGDPCRGLPRGRQLDSWSTRHDTVTLDCRGWRKARDKHGAPDLQTVKDCIAAIISGRGGSKFTTDNAFGEPRNVWARPFGKLVFSLADGTIITVFPVRGGWSKCADS